MPLISKVFLIGSFLSLMACGNLDGNTQQSSENSKPATRGASDTKIEQVQTESSDAKKGVTEKSRVMFYNVENLFDTFDDPKNRNDGEYLPTSERQWTKKRYDKKVADLARVIKETGSPDIIGLAEVENKKVVQDLAKAIGSNFGVIHQDSPDERGIDCALIYNKEHFKAGKRDFITVKMPREMDKNGRWRDDKTRDVVFVQGKLHGETVNIFVNHWASRRNPDEKRILSAKAVKYAIEKLQEKDENANIIVMGDFNDEPDNKSISGTLNALDPMSRIALLPTNLYNMSFPKFEQKEGSYNYKGDLNMLDQMIVSGAMMMKTNKMQTNAASFTIVKKDWMIYKHREYGPTPNRTYGSKYYGGVSDHFPVYIDLEIHK